MKQKHLTVLDIKFENRVAGTPIGMAYWAGTGPDGKTCRECVNYVFNGYGSRRLKRGPCQRFINLTGIESHNIPFDTASCKEFIQNPKPPTIKDQGK
jgi:hypothetical protein